MSHLGILHDLTLEHFKFIPQCPELLIFFLFLKELFDNSILFFKALFLFLKDLVFFLEALVLLLNCLILKSDLYISLLELVCCLLCLLLPHLDDSLAVSQSKTEQYRFFFSQALIDLTLYRASFAGLLNVFIVHF